MLEKVKTALRITTNAYNDELTNDIEAAKLDLGIAGVILPKKQNALVTQAIIMYCKAYFGNSEDQEKFKAGYDELKAQLSNATGYTRW